MANDGFMDFLDDPDEMVHQDIVNGILTHGAERVIINCVEIAVNDLTISNEDFLFLWSYYQAYNQPDFIKIIVNLNKLDYSDSPDITYNIGVLIDYAKANPDVVKFNDSLDVLINDNTEKQFILNHKDAFLKRCPVQSDIIEVRLEEAKKNNEMLLISLIEGIDYYRAFPQLWKWLKPFTCIKSDDCE